jgi:hypothetical protein
MPRPKGTTLWPDPSLIFVKGRPNDTTLLSI